MYKTKAVKTKGKRAVFNNRNTNYRKAINNSKYRITSADSRLSPVRELDIDYKDELYKTKYDDINFMNERFISK